MEHNNTKVAKPLKVVLWIAGGLALLLLTMAVTILIQQLFRPSQPAALPTESPTATPEPTPVPDRSYDSSSRPSFEPDTTRLGMSSEEIESYGEEYLSSEYWLDITPEELAQSTGCSVIRHTKLGYSYIVWNGDYYRLGEGDDGKGVLDVILCDLNADDQPDILYTYHFGTGSDAQTKVGWFDFSAKTSILSPFGMQRDFIALNQENGSCILYRCTRTVDENGGFALHFTDRIGEVIEQSDSLYLMLD